MSNSPPVISAKQLETHDALMRLDLACRELGVFYLVDHGLDGVSNLFDQAQKFFRLPKSEKLTISRTRNNPWGYFDHELTKNKPDWKEIFDFGSDHDGLTPRWPDGLVAFRHFCESHYQSCEQLSFQILAAVSKNLGVGGSFLFHAFEPEHSSFLRLNYYPPCRELTHTPAQQHACEGPMGVHHHTDAGALTLLMTDGNPGLEVYVHDQWKPIPHQPGALIINIGDIIQVWSNDRYKAPLHRVRVTRRQERISIPFFFNPHHSFDYAPLTYRRDQEPARYGSINWGEFRAKRTDGDYSDTGEEIQIEHFRIK
ncbi:MAG: hypothetical protein GKR90_09690 [Pseudomonadales bacterium]|nr:hypothetical protein [Pseudomonadales bacterium]